MIGGDFPDDRSKVDIRRGPANGFTLFNDSERCAADFFDPCITGFSFAIHSQSIRYAGSWDSQSASAVPRLTVATKAAGCRSQSLKPRKDLPARWNAKPDREMRSYEATF